MSVLEKIFGHAPEPAELQREAEARLEEARGFSLTAPREGLKALQHFAQAPLELAVDFGSPLHARFAEIAVRVLDAAARSATPTILPACAVYSDPAADARDAIAAHAAESDEGALFLRFPARWHDRRLTLFAVEALWMLARDPWLAAIYLGEDYAVFRNPVFAEAVEHLKADLSAGALQMDFNDVLRTELDLEEAPGLVTPCELEIFAYKYRQPDGE